MRIDYSNWLLLFWVFETFDCATRCVSLTAATSSKMARRQVYATHFRFKISRPRPPLPSFLDRNRGRYWYVFVLLCQWLCIGQRADFSEASTSAFSPDAFVSPRVAAELRIWTATMVNHWKNGQWLNRSLFFSLARADRALKNRSHDFNLSISFTHLNINYKL